MESTLSFRNSPDAGMATPATRVPIADDKAMLRAAAEMTRDLIAPRPRLYWADMAQASPRKDLMVSMNLRTEIGLEI